jgi:hypothetical protein
MWRLAAVTFFGLTLGAVMALGSDAWPIRPGIVGLVAMAATALAARRRWFGLDLAESGSPERGLWIALGGNAVILGHLATALWRIGAGMVMHSHEAHALGIDNWTLVAGALIAWGIARDPSPRRDERDARIAATGLRAAHYALIAMLIAGLVPLGFGWSATWRALSHPMIANAVIVLIIASVFIDALVRLGIYRHDAALARESAE